MQGAAIKQIFTTPGLIEQKDFRSILKSCIVSLNEVIELPPVCIEIVMGEHSATVGTLGNISLVIGKAKQGKTFALSLVLGAALSDKVLQDLIKVSLPEQQKKIILFDTEQSKYHVQKVAKRIAALSEKPQLLNIEIYSLRKYTPAERLEIIEFAIYNFSGVGLICIDGIRDLVSSINDEAESTVITSKLLKWSEEKNIHIINVLHQNKGDLNARGHLGTELTNKAETVLSVTKSTDDKNITIVKPEYCRDREFDAFAFSIDEFGLPIIVQNYETIAGDKPRSKRLKRPDDIDMATHKDIAKDVFSTQIEMLRSELKTFASPNISRWMDADYGKNKVDDWISHWLQFKIIKTNGGTPGTKACKYLIND